MVYMVQVRSRFVLAVTFAFALLIPASAQPADKVGKPLPLEGTHWSLISLNGKPVPHDGFEPHLILNETQSLEGGSTGNLSLTESPNELTGFYETGGNSLHMHMVTSTLVAVPVPRTVVRDWNTPPPSSSRSFVDAVRATSCFRIHGTTMELLDQNGVVLARLSATKAN